MFLSRTLILVSTFKNTLVRIDNILGKFNYQKINFNMDKLDKILVADGEIGNQIKALMSEVTDVECEIDKYLIQRLENENRELELEVQKFCNELLHLEKLCGRAQVNCSALPVSTSQSVKEEVLKSSSAPQPKNEAPANSSAKPKKDSKKPDKVAAKKPDATEAKNTAGEDPPVDIGRLNLKVGKILHVEKHPDADSLYVEKVDIGRTEPITVVSGLVKHIPTSDLLDSLVIILCNLKPAKMRGVTSEGMVMCASSEARVEVLRPPSQALPGESVLCPGFVNSPDPLLNPKKKIFETVAPDLKTDDEMIATYKGVRWTVGDKGFVRAQTLKGVNIK